MSTQSEFVKKYFLINEIQQQDAARKINISPSTLSNMLTGARPFSRKVAEALSREYGFSPSYLLMGIGPEMVLLHPTVDQSHNEGSIVNTGDKATINITAANAALQAENARLRDEVAWLRSELAKKNG